MTFLNLQMQFGQWSLVTVPLINYNFLCLCEIESVQVSQELNLHPMASVAVGISYMEPLGEKQGYLPYPIGLSQHALASLRSL